MSRGKWIIIACLGMVLSTDAFALYIGVGQCKIKVLNEELDLEFIPSSYRQEIVDNNMHIVDQVSSADQPQPTYQTCIMVLNQKCNQIRQSIAKPSLALGLSLGKAQLVGPMCYTSTQKEPRPSQVPKLKPKPGAKVIPLTPQTHYQDIPPQLQPGWLLQYLPKTLSEFIELDDLANWFDGFVAEIQRALAQMKAQGTYWMDYLSGVLWKILTVSVLAALVLLITPASALAGLAQLAAVALLILSILGANGIEVNQDKLQPGWFSNVGLNLEFDQHNNLKQDDNGILAGDVSVTYTLMEQDKPQTYQLYFASNKGRIEFYIQKNGKKSVERVWQMPDEPQGYQ